MLVPLLHAVIWYDTVTHCLYVPWVGRVLLVLLTSRSVVLFKFSTRIVSIFSSMFCRGGSRRSHEFRVSLTVPYLMADRQPTSTIRFFTVSISNQVLRPVEIVMRGSSAISPLLKPAISPRITFSRSFRSPMSDVEASSISIGIGASAGMLIAVSPMLYASVISAFGQQRVRNTSSGNIRQGPLGPRYAYGTCNVWLAEQRSPVSPRALSPVPPALPFSLVVNPHQPPSLPDVVGGDCFAPVARATQGGPGPGGGGLRPTCGRGVHHRPPQVRSCRSRRR